MDDSRKVIKVLIKQKSVDFVRSFSEKEWTWKNSGSYNPELHEVDQILKNIFFIVNDGIVHFQNYNDVIQYAKRNNALIKIIEEKPK